MMPNQDFLNALVRAIEAHAMPRPYDWYIFWVAAFSILISGFAIYFTYRIYKRQTKISERQAGIAAQQNSIALFEKRYEFYTMFRMLAHKAKITLSGIENDSISYDKMSFWVAFANHLIPEANILSSLGGKTHFDDAGEINKVIFYINSQINLYTLKLEKIQYIFSLNELELDNLKSIISRLNSFFDDATNEDVEYDDLKEIARAILKNIVNPTFCTTMQEQLNEMNLQRQEQLKVLK